MAKNAPVQPKKGPDAAAMRALPPGERRAWSTKPRKRRSSGGPSGKHTNGGAPPVYTVNDTHDPNFGTVGKPTSSAVLGPYKTPLPRGRTKVRG